MAKTFARIAGWLALLLGIIGFFVTDLLGLIQFDTVQNIIYLVLGVVGIAAGQSEKAAMLFAKIIGPVYLIVGIIGFFFPDLNFIHLEVTENLIHILLGAWGAYVAYGKSSSAEA
ncbi:DUF4383 domain-containing protein [Tumebacillus sp. ITR2]|uniref:DUF4383 domain-containing protein n=1 Tax=Tumebacillus amylolyticus TaxID=2801339 RepID=A0ABS1J7T7_9BACL|nr:DUF4383 domain-containing protein [Tumebacillus amylolyticus]MBL0386287.1 DUF4383 domain-containing protein [Tumebacillus amylolyticus]